MITRFLIGIGCARSSTTYFYNKLINENKNIFNKSIVKETNYLIKNTNEIKIEHYENMFLKKQDKNLINFEFSVAYFINLDLFLRNIDKIGLKKKVKIILILREPVSRTASEFKFKLKNGKYSNFQKIEDLNIEDSIFDNSLYLDRIKKLINYFGSEQIEIFNYDEIFSSSKKIQIDLNNSSVFFSPIKKNSSESKKNRFPKLYVLIRKTYFYILDKNLMSLYKFLKIFKIDKLIELIFFKNSFVDIDYAILKKKMSTHIREWEVTKNDYL